MAQAIDSRVLETTTSIGTGNITLAGAIAGFRAFSTVMALSDTCWYFLEATTAGGVPTGDWEVGLATYSVTNTLQRTQVYASSNSNNLVNFAAGTKRVGITLPGRAVTTVGINIALGQGVFVP